MTATSHRHSKEQPDMGILQRLPGEVGPPTELYLEPVLSCNGDTTVSLNLRFNRCGFKDTGRFGKE